MQTFFANTLAAKQAIEQGRNDFVPEIKCRSHPISAFNVKTLKCIKCEKEAETVKRKKINKH